MSKPIRRLAISAIIALTGGAAAQEPTKPPEARDETQELAKQAQNPIANLISVPFQNNTNFNYGPRERTQNVLNFQPVIPFKLTEDWNLITRTIVPIVHQPSLAKGETSDNASVWAAADKDAATKAALVASFAAADKELVDPLFAFKYNGRDIGRGWTVPVNASAWDTDYLNHTAASKAAMYENTSEETQYQFKETHSAGTVLDGNNQYTVTSKGETPPVNGFWSLALYNAEHFFNPNPLGVYSRGTKDKTLQYGEDGSLTLYLGATSPGRDKESNWLPAPSGTFSLLLRNYWRDRAVIDGTWLPPDVVKVK